MAGLLGSLKGGCPGRSYVLKTLRKKIQFCFYSHFWFDHDQSSYRWNSHDGDFCALKTERRGR